MTLLVNIIIALSAYLTSLSVLTLLLTVMVSGAWWSVSHEWVWVWEMDPTPCVIVSVLCIGVANFLIEDYAKCQCEDDDHQENW